MIGSSFQFQNIKAKSLNSVMPIIKGMCVMQFGTTQNDDVAIPVLVGDGGIGKTASILKMAKDSDFNLLDIHYGLIPLEEISGIPDMAEKVNVNGKLITNTNWTLPDLLGKAWELAENKKPTIVFLDDFHSSSPGNMALGYEMFTERKLRGYDFPPNTAFILAMNCSGSKSLANNIPAPIVNRLAMFPVTVDFEYWKTEFAIPNHLNGKIISFLSNNKYRKYFQGEETINLPWSSARSWTKLSSLLNNMERYIKTLNHSDIMYYSAAHVGEESASEFTAYYKIFSEIPVDDIFDEKIGIVIPDDLSNQYIFMLANITEFFNRISQDNLKKETYQKYIEICSNIIIEMAKKRSEIAVTGIKEIMLTSKSLKLTRIYDKIRTSLQSLDMSTFNRIKNDIGAI